MPPETKKILIVEDDQPLSRALRDQLERSGFEVDTFFDGKEALEVLGEKEFNLIILDLILPYLDGFKFLEIVKSKNIRAPIIVLSNLSQDEDIQRAKDLGAKEYFVKAETPMAELISHIKRILSSGGSEKNEKQSKREEK